MPNIIAVSNQKGGVGKTTTAVNLAACIAMSGRSTLLVDMDPQSNATSACGLDTNNLEATVYEALMDGIQPPVYDLSEKFPYLSLCPSSVDLAGAEFELIDRENREFAFKDVLARLAQPFDYIIVDSPPSLGLLTVNVLVGSDSVLVPVQAEYFALEGLSRMMMTIQRIQKRQNPELEVLGIVPTLFDARTNLAHQVVEELRRVFPNKIFNTAINRSVRLSEAPSYGKPIVYYDYRSTGAEQYLKLSEEVIHACEEAGAGAGA